MGAPGFAGVVFSMGRRSRRPEAGSCNQASRELSCRHAERQFRSNARRVQSAAAARSVVHTRLIAHPRYRAITHVVGNPSSPPRGNASSGGDGWAGHASWAVHTIRSWGIALPADCRRSAARRCPDRSLRRTHRGHGTGVRRRGCHARRGGLQGLRPHDHQSLGRDRADRLKPKLASIRVRGR